MCILRPWGRWARAALLLTLLILPFCSQVMAASSVVLAWDPSVDDGVTGYYLYYGGTSRAYTNRVEVGNTNLATISDLTPGGTYYFTATAFNAAGLESDYSNEASYTVPLVASTVPPAITLQPTSQSVTDGDKVTFTIAANGTAPLSYQWKKGGTTIPGGTNANLTLTAVTSNDAGSYTVTITNSAGSVTSGAALLTVMPVVLVPVITTQPASQTVAVGNSVVFTVITTGTAPLSYQWKKGGTSISGANSSTLSLQAVTSADAGSYTVVIANSVGSVTSGIAVLTVQPATVVTSEAASYTGLFSDPNGVSSVTSGSLTIKTTPTGRFTGKLLRDGVRSPISGVFDQAGHARVILISAYQKFVTLELQISPLEPDRLTGTVSDGTFTANLLADRAGFDGKMKLAPQSGRYTLVIDGNADSSATTPGGYGFGTITVSSAGGIRFAATLADGTKITQAAPLSKGGDWPLFAALYSGRGSIISWTKFARNQSDDISGEVVWIKPAVPLSKLYPLGFSFSTTAHGSRYQPEAKALRFNNGQLSLDSGDLENQILNQITLGEGNRVANLSNNKLTLTISKSTGLFSGKVLDPASSIQIPFKGAVLEKENAAFGWFPGRNGQSGAVVLSGR